ncbi:MAG: DedA family protein, partial [Planctomycetota bacterium]|nr:DedA family protein [Planctomycetota bacterium]
EVRARVASAPTPGRARDVTLGRMLDEVLRWVEDTEGPLPYAALALASGSEYVLPFLPGDTVTLFGAFLGVTTGRPLILIYVAINVGAILGSLVAYAFGRWIAGRPGAPVFESKRTRKAIALVQERFARHGAMYLAINRFLPALRAVFFVAAGMIRMPVWEVVLWGGLSALLWNALIVGVAWVVGDNWAALQALFERYTVAATALIVAVLVGFAARWAWRRWHGGRAAPEA